MEDNLLVRIILFILLPLLALLNVFRCFRRWGVRTTLVGLVTGDVVFTSCGRVAFKRPAHLKRSDWP